MRVRRFGVAAAVVATLLIFIATLTPSPGTVHTTPALCIACGDYGMVDLVANIVLFVPLGFAFHLAGARLRSAVLFSVAVTLFVEIMQLRVVAGRDASIGDLLANTLGGLVGAVLAQHARTIFLPSAGTALRLALGWCLVAAGVLAATSWGLSAPSIPRSLWVQWEPRRPPFDPFAGRLLALDVNGVALETGPARPSADLDDQLRRDEWSATAVVALDATPPGRAVIARIAAPAAILLSFEHTDASLHCRVRTRAAQYRLRPPRVTLHDALATTGNGGSDALRLTCGRRHAYVVAARDDAGGEAHNGHARDGYALPLSPSLGWTLLSPFELALDGRHEIVSALWLFALTLPFGFWMGAALRRESPRRSGSRSRSGGPARAVACVAALLGALVAGGVAAPLAWGTAVAAWWEWGAAVAGVAAGVAIAALVARATRSKRPQ